MDFVSAAAPVQPVVPVAAKQRVPLRPGVQNVVAAPAGHEVVTVPALHRVVGVGAEEILIEIGSDQLPSRRGGDQRVAPDVVSGDAHRLQLNGEVGIDVANRIDGETEIVRRLPDIGADDQAGGVPGSRPVAVDIEVLIEAGAARNQQLRRRIIIQEPNVVRISPVLQNGRFGRSRRQIEIIGPRRLPVIDAGIAGERHGARRLVRVGVDDHADQRPCRFGSCHQCNFGMIAVAGSKWRNGVRVQHRSFCPAYTGGTLNCQGAGVCRAAIVGGEKARIGQDEAGAERDSALLLQLVLSRRLVSRPPQQCRGEVDRIRCDNDFVRHVFAPSRFRPGGALDKSFSINKRRQATDRQISRKFCQVIAAILRLGAKGRLKRKTPAADPSGGRFP